MEIKSSGFWGNTYDEAAMSSSSSPEQEHMAFASAPNVQIYLENENEFLLADDLIELADNLGIQNETKIKIDKKIYTIFTNDQELYISGINKDADAYYFGEIEGDLHNIVYINSAEYSTILKRVIMLSAKLKWQNLMLNAPNPLNDSSCVRDDDIQKKQQRLFSTLCQHSKSITRQDIVQITYSKKWDIRIWIDLNYNFIKKKDGFGRIRGFFTTPSSSTTYLYKN